jgi:TPR repeat protein
MGTRPVWAAMSLVMMVGCGSANTGAGRGPQGLDDVPVAAADGYYLQPDAPAQSGPIASEEAARCEGGDAAACNSAGKLYARGERVALDYQRADTLFLRACDLGEPDGCYQAGMLVTGGTLGDPPDFGRALGLYQRACDGGVAGACTNLGSMTMRGEGREEDVPGGRALYERACEGGDALGCTNLASFLRGDLGGKDMAAALALYERACAMDHGEACEEAAEQHDEGAGTPVNDPRARELYGKACALKVGQGCNNLGAMYESGEGGAKAQIEALKLYTQACELDDRVGCRNIGRILILGETEQQQKLGVQSLALACKQNDLVACVLLGQCLEEGTGIDRDLPMALQLYSFTCEAGLARGCFAAGVFVDEARGGGTRDAERALSLYAKACDAQELRGCYNAAWMLEKADGVPADVPRALTFYERACSDTFPKGCLGASKLYRTRATPDDLTRARELLAGLCERSDADSCELLGQMLESGQGGPADAKGAGRARAQACALGYKESCDKL